MITGMFGFPRAGKTTTLAYFSQRAIAGKPLFIGHGFFRTYITEHTKYNKIFSTVPLPGCFQLDFDMLGHYNYHDCLIIIDEISHFCDCRDWKNFTSDLRYFFTMHGHYNVDIIYCGQNYKDCDKKITNMTMQLLKIQKRGGFTIITPMKAKECTVNGIPELRFVDAPPLGRTFIRRKKYYSLFDSFDRKQLPDFEPVPW